MSESFWPTAIFKRPIDPIRFDHRNRSFYVGIVPSTHCSLNMAVGQTVRRVARVPGALPLAMLRKAFGHVIQKVPGTKVPYVLAVRDTVWPLAIWFGRWRCALANAHMVGPLAIFFGQLAYASVVGDVNWLTAMFFGQRP